MAVQFVTPEVPTPYRVILMGAVNESWLTATDEERRGMVLPRFKQMIEEWKEIGAKVLATIDDDLFMVGPPGAPHFTWYLIMEVPKLEALAAMIHRLRVTVDGVRLDKYIRIESRIGRPFFLLEGAAH